MNEHHRNDGNPASTIISSPRVRPGLTRRTTGHRVLLDQVFSSAGFKLFLLEGAERPPKPKMKIQDLRNPMVLHVDDDEDLLDAVTTRLKASGYRVASALDGETGVKSALLYPTDVIVLDYDMPNGKGDAIIDLLKGNCHTCNIPIIILTAVHKRGLKRDLLSRGADAFMTKPFDFEALESTIADLVHPMEQ